MSDILDLFEMPAEIPGADALAARLGPRHTFHDAEIESLTMTVPDRADIHVRTWRITAEIDGQGRYVLRDHTRVTFQLTGVREFAFEGFAHQNVAGSIHIERLPVGYRLVIGSSIGLDGAVEADALALRVEPCDSDI